MSAFSVFKDRKTKKTAKETPTAEGHYARLGRVSAFFRYTCLVVIILLCVYAFSFHGDEMTMDNFRYMLKFINFGDDAETHKNGVLNFDTGSGSRGLIFKGDLCVMNENSVMISGWDGDVLVRENFGCDHPKMTENGINLFCYDLGGNELRIYNSYSRVYEHKYDYPIYDAAASASGRYAVVTSEKGFQSAVHVYDEHFREVFKHSFSKLYTDFVEISPDGKEVITLSHRASKGNLVTTLTRFDTTKEDGMSTLEFVGELPLGIYRTDYGTAVLTSSRFRSYDSDFLLKGECEIDGSTLTSVCVGKEYSVFAYGTGRLSGGTELSVCLPDGTEKIRIGFEETFSDIMTSGDKIWALSPGKLTVCDISGNTENKTYEIPTSFNRLLSDDGKPILFSDSEARYFREDDYGGNK